MSPHSSGNAFPQKAGRPSLYAEAASNAIDMQADSILGELEYSRPRRKSLIAVFVAALASAAAIGWWQAGGFVEKSDIGAMELATLTDGGKAPDNIVATAAPSQAAPQPADSRPADAGLQPQGEKEDLPANIVADIAPVSGAQETQPSAQLSANTVSASQETDKPSIAAGQVAIAGPEQTQASAPAPALISTPAPTIASTRSVATAAPADPASALASAKPTTPASPTAIAFSKEKLAAHSDTRMAAKVPAAGKPHESSARAATIARSAPQKGKRAEKDGDVELIAALLNRVSTNAEPAGAVKSPKTGSAGAQQRIAAIEQKKKTRKSPAIRENVALNPVSSTESELKRCISLGFLESELCRFRACSGRWGRDPACPESDQVSSAMP